MSHARLMTTPSRFVLSRLSRELYVDFLDKARARGFAFVRFRDFLPGAAALPARYIALRHDIDVALAYALDMAEIEHAAGVRSTFFVLVDGQFYNPLEPATVRQIRQIHALGHEVGLHFAVGSAVHADVGDEVLFRLKILSDILGAPVRSFSQHDPVNAGFANVNLPPGQEAWVNAYEVVRAHDLLYVSESAMMWRDHTFETALNQGRNLCLLAHAHSWLHPQHDYIALIREIESQEVLKVTSHFDAFVDALVGYYERRMTERV